MKWLTLFSATAIILCYGCGPGKTDNEVIVQVINKEIQSGNISRALEIADSIKERFQNRTILNRADSLAQVADRIRMEFPKTEKEIYDQLLGHAELSLEIEDIKEYEEKGWLEYRIIDGEKKYFTRAAVNLLLLKNFNLDRAGADSAAARDSRIISRKKQTESILLSSHKNEPADPVKMEILFTVTVEPDAVPPGETVKCWIPYPKEGHRRQKEVYLLGVSDDEFFILAPDSVTHRSVYLEKKAEKGKPVIFSAAYTFVSSGQYFNPDSLKITPYDKRSQIYRKYTLEQPPHIIFSDKVKKLTDSIVGDEKNPYEITRKIYFWISGNIPWINSLEYSAIPDIPEYVIANRRGDCGMQTFLFMSMVRYKGIPVRWQSGWILQPDIKTIHDWCEVYYQGTGWVPLDLYYNLQYSNDKKVREFFITGIDSYRLIFNDGIAGELYPAKKFLRSDPYDFQRGEVEWSGGNLYFDKWDYKLDVKYLPADNDPVTGR